MDHTDLMSFQEGLCDLSKDREGVREWEGLIMEDLLECVAFEQLHDHELCDQDVVFFVLAVSVNTYTVWVVESTEDLDFSVETISKDRIGDLFVELDREFLGRLCIV